MEVIATSLIAVCGTLLGSGATFLIQRSTVRHQEALSRAERLRQERVDAFTGYAGALIDYRRVRMDQWHRGRGETGLDPDELRREVYRVRGVAVERGFRVHLLTESPELVLLGDDALTAVDRIASDVERSEYNEIRRTSKAAIHHFVEAARDVAVPRP